MPIYPTNQPLQPQQQVPIQPQDDTQQPEGRRQKGTGFTNISSMLAANTGAGTQMGQKIGGGLSQKAGQLTGDVATAKTGFETQYQNQYQQNLGAGSAIGQVQGMLPTGSDTSGAISTLDPNQAINLYSGMQGAGYTGQTGLENEQQLMNRAANLQNLSTLAGMGSIGQYGLLTSGVRGAYGRGLGALDQALIGQSQEAQDAIRRASTQAIIAGAQTGREVGGAAGKAQALTDLISSTKADVQKGISQASQDVEEQGHLAAQSLLQDADRAKILLQHASEADKYMGHIINPDGTLGPYDETQAAKDQQILANLDKIGFGSGSVYAIDPNKLDEYIQTLASKGDTSYTGQTLYSQQQQNALKNLAFLGGNKDLARNIASTVQSPYNVTQQAVEGSDYQKDQLGKIDDYSKNIVSGNPEDPSAIASRLPFDLGNNPNVVNNIRQSQGITINADDLKDPEKVKGLASEYQAGLDALNNDNRYGAGLNEFFRTPENSQFSMSRALIAGLGTGNPVAGLLGGLTGLLSENKRESTFEGILTGKIPVDPNSFLGKAFKLIGRGTAYKIYKDLDLGSTTPYRVNKAIDAIADAYRKRLEPITNLNNVYSSKTTLKDYLNKKFGIKSGPLGGSVGDTTPDGTAAATAQTPIPNIPTTQGG